MSHKFLEIVHNRSLRGLPLERVYRKLKDKDLLLMAYGNLYSKKGAMTPGIDPKDTVDGMSLKRIDKIIEDLDKGSYKWNPVRRKEIDKGNGKLRPLGILTWSDKLLQEAIRLILEAYYEPKFSKHSHAYRPGRGCHTALQYIQKSWTGVKWWIKIDIRGCFDTIDHDLLLNNIFKDIKDVRFRKLLKEMLKAGYMKNWKYHQTHSGTPQGGVISPILSNIMLDELDKYVENELKPAYSRGKRRRTNPEYHRYGSLIARARKAGDKETCRRLVTERRTIPSTDTFDPNFRRLKYCRYADDILIGFIGPKAEACEIKTKIQNYLQTIGLEASPEKTQIIHATEKVRFLNYDIYIAQRNSKITSTANGIKRRSINGQPTLTVPYETKQNWLKRYSQKGKPIHRAELMNSSDYEIISTYDAQIRGLVNYYVLAINVSKLNQVKYHLGQSLVKTLAAKHNTSITKIFKKYGTKGKHSICCISVVIKNSKNPDKPLVATYGDIPIKRKKSTIIVDDYYVLPHIGRNELVRRLLANECELCGSHDDNEVHHVKALKNIKKKYAGRQHPPEWAVFMMKRNRKTVVVCRACHTAIHNGKYDGKKVN